MKDDTSLTIGPIHMQSFLFCLHFKSCSWPRGRFEFGFSRTMKIQ